MLLSCRILDGVSSANDFEYKPQAEWVEGTPTTVYLQLIDVSKDRASKGFSPAGRRYVPAAGATLQVVVESIDDAKTITRTATQPFATDGSIWSFSVLATDTIKGTATIRLRLSQSGVITYGSAIKAVSIIPQDAI
jgi:hypothetical protein